MVSPEQGLGDTLQFVRYLKLAGTLGHDVFFESPRTLLPLLRASGFTGLVPKGTPLPPYDVQIPLLSLPYALGTTLENLPAPSSYLTADPRLLKHWRGQLRGFDGFKVGIVWQGNRDYLFDHFRSIPLCEYAPLAEVPGVRLFSLQRGFGSEQLADNAHRFQPVVFGESIDTEAGPFMDTAAIMCNLDLVITSDTAAAHLAGALGVPVWLAVSAAPEWRWMTGRADSPWYPSMRLFRQPRLGDWASVFAEMSRALDELTKKSPAAN
jgi:hypothetical protein